MADQIGPRCGNNPNVRLTPGDQKVIDDFRARLALQGAAKPHIEAAAWVDGDPLMEVIAVTLWQRCARDDEDMPQLVRDDPRTIAAFAAAVARAHAQIEQPAEAEDPARIDRLRPEFFEHASVESIDVQIRRAQTQQRQWENRVKTLAILRQARVKQMELGEWPATPPAGGAPHLKEARPTVGYSNGYGSSYCLGCAPAVEADVPLTADDVTSWELCPSCGRHIVDVPRSAEEPHS